MSADNEIPVFTWHKPFSRATCCWVFPLVGLLFVQWCAFKLHKLYLMTRMGADWLGALVPVLCWDVFLLLWLALFFACWLEWTRGTARRLGLVCLHLVVVIGLLAGAVEHRFFTITHALVNWEMLQYGIQQFWMLSSMIASQFNLWTLLLMAVFLGIVLLPMLLMQSARVKRWCVRDPGRGVWRSPLAVLAGMSIWLLLMAWCSAPLSRHIEPLRSQFLGHWLAGFLQSRHVGHRVAKYIQLDREKLLFDAQLLRFVPGPKTRKPNIVLIVLESMRWRSTTMARPDLQTTPFLAALAKKSMVVEDMVPVVPHTSKALVAMLCGIYPKITMTVSEAELGGLPARCLPKLLGDLGYQSAIFHPGTMRFEKHEELYRNMGFQGIVGHEKMPVRGFFRTNYFGYEDRIMHKPSLQWLDQAIHRKKPFFLTLHYLTSHHSYNTPPSFRKHRFVGRRRGEYHDYLNALRYIDDFTRDLFADFRKRGMMDNTIFVLAADHGEAFGEHRRYQHDNSLWQEVLKIPVMIYSPAYFPKGGRIKGPRQQTDFLPTIAELMRVDVKGGRVSGSSLLQPPPAGRKRFLSCWYEQYCLGQIKEQYKVIYNYHRASMELYDLNKDPQERRDLSHLPVYQAMLDEARQSMLAWKTKVNHVYEAPDPHRLSVAVRDTMPRIDRFLHASIGPWLRLVGVQQHTKELRPGGAFDLTMVFRVDRPIPQGWKFFFHFRTSHPARFLNMDHIPVGGRYPLQQWRKGLYVLDRYRATVPPDFPPGATFEVAVGLWAEGRGRALVKRRGLTTEETRLRYVSVQSGKLASPQPGVDGRPPLERLRSARFGDLVTFVGYNLHSRKHRRGSLFDITLVFKALRPVPKGWQLFVHMKQLHPKMFLNPTHILSPRPPPLWKWKKGRMMSFRLRMQIPRAFQPKLRLHLVVGIWHPHHPHPRITAPKEERDVMKRGHLIVLREPLR